MGHHMKVNKGHTPESWCTSTQADLLVSYLLLLHSEGEALLKGTAPDASGLSLSHAGMITSYWGALQHLLEGLAGAKAQAEAKAASRATKIITPN